MKTTLALVAALALCGCSRVAGAPRDGLFPMWTDASCWSASKWERCQVERRKLHAREGHFVEPLARTH